MLKIYEKLSPKLLKIYIKFIKHVVNEACDNAVKLESQYHYENNNG